MKTEAKQKFEIIIRDCFHSILKPLEFKKKGRNFYRKLPNLGQIVNVQKSAFFSKEHISFTINVGIFIPEYWLTYYTYHNGEIPDYPTESDCVIRERIGDIKYNTDKWFDIKSGADITDLKKETMDNILNYILPYFDKYNDKAKILQLLQSENIYFEKFTKLIILGEYKQFDLAQIEYDNLKQDKYTFNNDKSTLLEYRDKYGLRD